MFMKAAHLGDPPGEFVVVDGLLHGGKMSDLCGSYAAFMPADAPAELFEVAKKLKKKSR